MQGLICQKQGRCTEAISSLRKSISLDPNYGLPWPEMSSAGQDLASAGQSCRNGTELHMQPEDYD
ncbi:MAG: hypothetical protein ACE14P_09520 [Methanotrichaceae archaeon]